jgi:hypothetical protein
LLAYHGRTPLSLPYFLTAPLKPKGLPLYHDRYDTVKR